MDSRSAYTTLFLACGVLALASAGCSHTEDPAPEPLKVTTHLDLSKGKILKPLVGVWKFKDGTYGFRGDGSYLLHYDRIEPVGPGQKPKRSTGDEKGRWTADSSSLYLKGAKGIDFKMAYTLSQGGNALELSAPHAKNPDVFTRMKS